MPSTARSPQRSPVLADRLAGNGSVAYWLAHRADAGLGAEKHCLDGQAALRVVRGHTDMNGAEQIISALS